MSKYSQIQDNAIFMSNEGRFKKIDAIYYEDLQSGFQSAWSPLFDATIITDGDTKNSPDASIDPANNAYTIDPQSRMITRNPNYDPSKRDGAEKAFADMWGSAGFDCAPDDYDYMAVCSIAAVAAMDELAKALDLPARLDTYPTIVGRIIESYTHLHYETEPVEPAKAKKAVAKKSAKKAPAKKKPAKKATKKATRK